MRIHYLKFGSFVCLRRYHRAELSSEHSASQQTSFHLEPVNKMRTRIDLSVMDVRNDAVIQRMLAIVVVAAGERK